MAAAAQARVRRRRAAALYGGVVYRAVSEVAPLFEQRGQSEALRRLEAAWLEALAARCGGLPPQRSGVANDDDTRAGPPPAHSESSAGGAAIGKPRSFMAAPPLAVPLAHLTEARNVMGRKRARVGSDSSSSSRSRRVTTGGGGGAGAGDGASSNRRRRRQRAASRQSSGSAGESVSSGSQESDASGASPQSIFHRALAADIWPSADPGTSDCPSGGIMAGCARGYDEPADAEMYMLSGRTHGSGGGGANPGAAAADDEDFVFDGEALSDGDDDDDDDALVAAAAPPTRVLIAATFAHRLRRKRATWKFDVRGGVVCLDGTQGETRDLLFSSMEVNLRF